jgi:two-component sensor histidine kinase
MGKEGTPKTYPLVRWWFAQIKWPATGTPKTWPLAASFVLAGAVLKPLLELLGGEPLPPYITFYPAVVMAALVGGPVIGISCALITLAIASFFLHSVASSLPAAIIYAFTSVFLGWVIGHARLAFDAAKAHRTYQEYAARESVHRIKNLIAVVQAISNKVFREVKTTEQYRDILSERMRGLEIAQRILLEQDWRDVPLGTLIDSALAPFLPNPGLTLRRGPEATIPAGCVRGLSMALYELCTNAMKYGALAEGRGPVLLTWKIEGGKVVLDWEERTATDPRHIDGFGATLIRVALAGHSEAHVDYRVDPDGVHASFQWHAPAQTNFSHAAVGNSVLPVGGQVEDPNRL